MSFKLSRLCILAVEDNAQARNLLKALLRSFGVNQIFTAADGREAQAFLDASSEAIDLILEHIETHGDNLWGHAIPLPESAGGGIRLVSRTNYLSENFFGALKHDERRRSGYKNLGHVLENLPAEATLVRNLEHDDYVTTLCDSLDGLAAAFARLDRQEL